MTLKVREGKEAAFITTTKAIEYVNLPLNILVFRQAPTSNCAKVDIGFWSKKSSEHHVETGIIITTQKLAL